MTKRKQTKRSGAVARVKEIISKMRGAERRDVIAACIHAGVRADSAATLYQRWYRQVSNSPTGA